MCGRVVQARPLDVLAELFDSTPTPLLAAKAGELLAGQPADDQTIARAAEAACQIVTPITDMRGTVDYRRHVTGVLVRRVLQAAVARARGEPLNYQPGH